MKHLKNRIFSKSILCLSVAMLSAASCTMVNAAKKEKPIDPSIQAVTDSMVQSMRFQFEPITLHGQANGIWVPTDHTENVELPLWLLINMSGPISFDTTQYKLQSVERVDKTWLLNATLSDSISGEFDLQFIIEGNGKSLLKLTDAEGNKNLYEGNIYPHHRVRVFEKEKAMKRALATQKVIDSIVPILTFQVNYQMNSQDYRNRPQSIYRSSSPLDVPTIQPNRILVTPRILINSFAQIKYMNKVNDNWYLRIEYKAARQPLQKRAYADYCINSLTGETYVRGGYYDRIPSNWRHYKERAGFTNPA